MALLSTLKNIAVVGASGNVGSYIASALLAKNHFNVTAITRTESKATFPSGVRVARIDYNSPDTIVKALTGHDALVITLSVFSSGAQEQLIRGAAQAGVPWVLPNEFGMYNTEEIQNETIGSGKTIARLLIESLGVSSWIGVTSGFWYEYSLSGGYYGIDIPKREVTFIDDGKQRLNTATWAQTGLAVANLLSLPVSASDGKGPALESYRNRMLFISSFALSQREMFEAVQKATGTTEKDWKIKSEPARERLVTARQRMRMGDHKAFATVLYTRYFIEDAGLYEKSHGLNNDQLGLPKESLDSATKRAVDLSYTDYHKRLYS